MIVKKKISHPKKNNSIGAKKKELVSKKIVNEVVSVDQPPVLSSHTKIQTAEGWKRSQLKLLKAKQKKP
jgi:hypothetical protein